MIRTFDRPLRRGTLVAGFAVLALACAKDPTEGKNQAKVAPATGGALADSTPPAKATTETLAISPEISKIGFVGAKVTEQHAGSFRDFAGTITLVKGQPEASRVEVTIQVASVAIEPEKLAGHLKSPDFFDVATYPTARFTSTEIKRGSDAPGMTHTVTGNLQLRGTTKSVTFPAAITVASDTVAVKSEFGINRKDFGIVYPGKPDDLINDNVLIQLDVRATRTPSKA